jgi:4-amino-4-deoxy-L-arabinose transferase-like glycosyltransferase
MALRRDRRALACLGLALLVLGGGLALVLAGAGVRRSGTDGVWVSEELTAFVVPAGTPACQGGELVPADTGALRIPVIHGRGLATVTVSRGARVLARGGGRVDPRTRVLVASIPTTRRDVDGARVCLRFRSQVALPQGRTVPDVQSIRIGGSPGGSSMAIDYLQPGRRSWWDEISSVASRLALGRGDWGGSWIVWLLGALVAAALALTGWVLARTVVASRAMERTALIVMAVAVLNAVAWSIITPPFQAPDEGGHVAYVQSIAETGRPQHDPRSTYVSPELMAALAGTRIGTIWARTARAAVWSPAQQRRLSADLHAPLSRQASVYLGPAEPEPPLYYTLEVLPYELGHGATLLDRIALMRLGSALLAGVTALLAFLFVRECLPARRWAWTVGGLAVAFTPKLTFIGGSVTPDALMFALAAALFLCLARAWRRGATVRLARWTGAVIAAGMLAKVNFYALVPGALLALALAARRGTGRWDRGVARVVGLTAALGVGGFAIGTALQALVWHRPFVVGRPPAPESHVGLLRHLSFIWQVLLPRLPFQADQFHGYPLYDQVFKTFAGAYGPLMVWFPAWVYEVGAGLLGGAALLALRALLASPRELRWRRPELLGYGVMSASTLLLVAISADLRRNTMPIIQGRYLLPLVPLFGALLALGARGAGERWGRAAGVAIVAAAVAWTLYSQLLTVAWFYS